MPPCVCVGTNDKHNQISFPLESLPLSLFNKGPATLSALELSEAIEAQLDWKDSASLGLPVKNQFDVSNPVIIRESVDAHLLRCARPGGEEKTSASILGIEENQVFYSDGREGKFYNIKEEKNLNVTVKLFRPKLDGGVEGCNCHHPHGDWTRRPCQNVSVENNDGNIPDAEMKIFDMTTLQKYRRERGNTEEESSRFDTPGHVCHLLRSTLFVDKEEMVGTSLSSTVVNNPHFASPWTDNSVQESKKSYPDASESSARAFVNVSTSDQIIGILMCNQLDEDYSEKDFMVNQNQSYWDALEMRELSELIKFRTGDACPSFYLYSISSLTSDFTIESLGNYHENSGYTSEDSHNYDVSNGYTLLIYRQLPPRNHFAKYKNDTDLKLPIGCLFEQFKSNLSSEEKCRIVAPPYQNHEDVFSDLLAEIFSNPVNIKTIANEARRIPQWTAWPEKTHYQAQVDDDAEEAAPSWTVFPLCHTFPATNISARKWISKTCAFVPETTALLKSLGPALRTALFSRLDPRTTLGDHTGWADLANHVLRVHIPLIVPSGVRNDGLCGT